MLKLSTLRAYLPPKEEHSAMDQALRTRNQIHGKAKRTLKRLQDAMDLNLKPSRIRAELDKLDDWVRKIDDIQNDYIDRRELDPDYDPEKHAAELVTLDKWMSEWEELYKPKVKEAVTQIKDFPADNLTPSQSSTDSIVSQPSVTSGGAGISDSLESTLAQLALATNAQRPPAVQVPIYDGNPKNFTFFLTLFDELVAKVCPNQRVKLAQLLCYVSGPALEAIHHAMSYPAESCYDKAIDILKNRFGNKTEIARIALQDLYDGPICVSASELNSFVEELDNTKRQVASTVYANALNSHEAIDKLLIRLPSDVQNKWTKVARKHKKTKNSYPDLENFLQFLIELAEEFGDHMYGIDSTRRRAELTRARAGGKQSSTAPSVALSGTTRNSTVELKNTFTALQKNETASRILLPSEFRNELARPQNTIEIGGADFEQGAVAMISKQQQKHPGGPQKDDGRPCPFCNQQKHNLVDCSVFCGASQVDRWDRERLSKAKNCWKCLTLKCDRVCNFTPYKCCGLPYHILLHPHHCLEIVNNMATTVSSSFILPIVEVFVGNIKTYAYLDNCSTHSFVTEKLLEMGDLTVKDEILYSSGSIHGSQNLSSKIVDLTVRPPTSHVRFEITNAFVVPRLPAGRRAVPCDLEDNPHLNGLPLAAHLEDVEVSVLIGQDHAHLLTPLEVRKHPDFSATRTRGRPYAVKTLLGWAISGRGSAKPVDKREVALISKQYDLETNIQRLWDVERELDDVVEKSITDRRVENEWRKTYTIDSDNHYVVSIPLKNSKVTFPDNREYALNRLTKIIRNLKSKNAFESYRAQILSMITDGYAEKVPMGELVRDDFFIFYLPHFPVYHPDKPGKVRVVNDCKAEYEGVSVNNVCLSGPDLLNKLIHVLLRFRIHQYAWAADVAAMYFQVRIPKEQRDMLRFLWLNDAGIVEEYRMVGHVMGGVWSSASSTFAIRQAVVDRKSHPKVVHVINKSLYVDDALHSEEKEEDAELTAHGCYTDLKANHFNFCKFVSTHQTTLRRIPEELHGDAVKIIEGDPETKALGLRWNIGQDYFYYVRDKLTDHPNMTKRKLLSQVATLYDPLGLIQPIILVGKLIFQKVTRLSIGWDDLLPPSELNAWKRWFQGLENIHKLRFPRCLIGTLYVGAHKELHTFCDASEAGYGTVTYLRAVPEEGDVKVIIIMGKGRVSPNKALTIPRLELLAAFTGIKQEKVIRRETGMVVDDRYFWTDSIIVLHYLKNPALRLKTFVARRIDAILEHSDAEQWHHVRTDLNPADIVSRGVHVAEELPDLWVSGPGFLRRPKEEWPVEVTTLPVPKEPLEVKSMLLATSCGYLTPADPAEHCQTPCYGGEHVCLLGIAERGEPTLVDSFCFTCKRSKMIPVDKCLSYPPEEVITSSTMAAVTRSMQKKAERDVISVEQEISCSGIPEKTKKKILEKPAVEDQEVDISTTTVGETKVEQYLSVPWPRRPHLIYADPIGSMIRYHGDADKLVRTYAWWRRPGKLSRGERLTDHLSVEELQEAELLLVRHVQHEVYAAEIKALKERRRIPVASDLLPLNPCLKDDMLVVQGRLRHLAATEVNAHPYILPKNHHLSLLLCRRVHYSTHVGSEWALAMLRKKYWIISARSILRNVRRTCVSCQRFHKAPEQQKMADLPPERLVAGPVCFLNVGVDLFGPFHVVIGRASIKRYGAIFTCLSARAVHLEVVYTMNTDSFVMALMRFICRRGIPLKMLSDNGTNIVGAETELNAAWCDVDTDALTLAARNKGIDWKFNPPKASNMGGVWERQIRTVRSCLNPILRAQSSLDDETLHTSFVEVENLINSRPLTKVSKDPEDGVLTPNHLLILQDNVEYSAQELDLGAVYRRKWKRVMQIRDQFWKTWTSRYLQELQLRQKWHHESPELVEDDVVLQVDAGLPRGVWPLAVVTSTKISHDGRVRSVDIKTTKSNYTRPVNKLVKLELD